MPPTPAPRRLRGLARRRVWRPQPGSVGLNERLPYALYNGPLLSGNSVLELVDRDNWGGWLFLPALRFGATTGVSQHVRDGGNARTAVARPLPRRARRRV